MIKFTFGLNSKYQALATKDADTLYFITDTKKIYKGDTVVAECNVAFTSIAPTVDNTEAGVLYVYTSADSKTSLWINSGSSVVQVGGGEATELADGIITISKFSPDTIATTISTDVEQASDAKLVTEKAVATIIDSVKAQLQGEIDTAFVNVSVGPSPTEGKFCLNFYKSATPDTNPVSVELDKEQYLLDAKVETRQEGDPAVDVQYLVLTVQVLDGKGGTTSREVAIKIADLVQVDASTVKTTKEITLTTSWGLLTPGTKIPVSDIQSILVSALSKDVNPTATAPYISSVSLTGAGAKEVGTEFTPSYTVNYTDGSYKLVVDGKTTSTDANCTATGYSVSDTNGGSATTATGSFTKFTVTESTNYSVSATVSYGQGDMPKTYLGNDYDAVRIAAGTTPSKKSTAVTGYRAFFYGYKGASEVIADPTAITSAQVRGLGNNGRSFPATLTTNQMQQIFFACPAGTYSTCTVINSTNGAPQTVKKVTGIMVEGANGYTAASYDVFYVSNAGPEGGSTKFNLTFSK